MSDKEESREQIAKKLRIAEAVARDQAYQRELKRATDERIRRREIERRENIDAD